MAVVGRRRRRKHSAEFKAEAVKACQQTGVSIAAVALSRCINANLLRRWVKEAEGAADAVVTVAATTRQVPAFVPLAVERTPPPCNVQIELQRGTTSVKVTWPATAAADCAAWLRELLR